MKKHLRIAWESKKNRLRRNLREAMGETLAAVGLVTAMAAVTLILVVGYTWLTTLPALKVREVVVRGCRELTEKEVIALAEVPSQPNILTVNTILLARRLEANPWVRKAYVGRELPDRLVIIVKERTAVALLQDEGALYLLDEEGDPFKKLEAGDEANLPVLTGFTKGKKVNAPLVKKAISLIKHVSESQDLPAVGAASEVHADETFGLSLFTDRGLCLQMGFEGYENKLRKLAPVLADLEHKGLSAGFLLIDLNDPGKINVQKRAIDAPLRGPGNNAMPKGYRM